MSETRSNSPEYLSYMRSDEWALQRLACFARAGYCCIHCKSTKGLEAHHLTYDRLGHEDPGDLVALCKPCHKVADKQREAKRDRDNAGRLWEARLNGWATRRYGRDWESLHNVDQVEQEFEDWLDTREDW